MILELIVHLSCSAGCISFQWNAYLVKGSWSFCLGFFPHCALESPSDEAEVYLIILPCFFFISSLGLF